MKPGFAAAPLIQAVMRSGMRDLIARFVAYLIASMLLAIAFGFLVATLYLALAEFIEAPLAALTTSLVFAGAAGLIVLGVRYRSPRKPAAGAAGADALLLSISEQVRREPWLSVAIAAVLGALTGIAQSPSNRPPA